MPRKSIDETTEVVEVEAIAVPEQDNLLAMFVWRHHARGIVVVIAQSEDKAREYAINQGASWAANLLPEVILRVEPGTAWLYRQRG